MEIRLSDRPSQYTYTKGDRAYSFLSQTERSDPPPSGVLTQ
ncbi:hypothetical protein [Nostoc sp.]